MKKLLTCIALGFATTSYAVTPLWMRDVQISPDGTEIAFCYKGDIYKVPAKGGTATQLIKCRSVADVRSKYWEHPPRWFASINPERHSYTKTVRASRMNGVNIIPRPSPGIYGCTIRKLENIPI